MNTKGFSELMAQQWKLLAGVVAAAILVIVGIGIWKDRAAKREAAATNLLYETQVTARNLAAQNKMEEATKAYDPLFEKFPKSRAAYEGHLQIGDIWMDARNFENASKYYEMATHSAPDTFSRLLAQYNLGIAQETSGQLQQAVATYETALKNAGSDFLRPELLMAQARCYEALGQPDKAIEVYKMVQEKFATRTYYSGAASAFEKQLSSKAKTDSKSQKL